MHQVSLDRILADPDCAGRRLLALATGKWGLLVLVALGEGEQRYYELSRGIAGISDKMLSQTLRELTAQGLVARTADASVPPKVTYRLKARSRLIVKHLRELIDGIAQVLPQGYDPDR